MGNALRVFAYLTFATITWYLAATVRPIPINLNGCFKVRTTNNTIYRFCICDGKVYEKIR